MVIVLLVLCVGGVVRHPCILYQDNNLQVSLLLILEIVLV
jgi:hypothetical protein